MTLARISKSGPGLVGCDGLARTMRHEVAAEVPSAVLAQGKVVADVSTSMKGAVVAPVERRRGPVACGTVAAGFEQVRDEFERNFAERGEIGAAVSAYWRGENVVDLWGGRRSPFGDAPWEEDTMVLVHSTTKGISAMTLAIANARGWLDYEAPVSRYWPEFAQNG